MQEFYKKELANIDKETKGYLKFAREVFEVLSVYDDPYKVRKELIKLFYIFFKCKKVIYSSVSQIISVPKKLSPGEIRDIKTWFDLRIQHNYFQVTANGDVKTDSHKRSLPHILEINATLPVVFGDGEYDKKVTSYIDLGNKLSGEPFSKTEIDYLEKIASYLDIIAKDDYKELENTERYKPENKVKQMFR